MSAKIKDTSIFGPIASATDCLAIKHGCFQDVLWMPKCLRRGWYLPYDPPHNEYGAWKWHYVACLKTLDLDVLSKDAVSIQM